MIQKLELVERRWDSLLNGKKVDTIRIDEGKIEPGFLVYERNPHGDQHCVVYVTDSMNITLKEVLLYCEPEEKALGEQVLLEKMKAFYPDITLDTKVDFIKHLSVPETNRRYPKEVDQILSKITLQGDMSRYRAID